MPPFQPTTNILHVRINKNHHVLKNTHMFFKRQSEKKMKNGDSSWSFRIYYPTQWIHSVTFMKGLSFPSHSHSSSLRVSERSFHGHSTATSKYPLIKTTGLLFHHSCNQHPLKPLLTSMLPSPINSLCSLLHS